MSRLYWNRDGMAEVPNPRIDAFLADLEAVCRKHRLDLRHEDSHGAFEVHELGDGDEPHFMAHGSPTDQTEGDL